VRKEKKEKKRKEGLLRSILGGLGMVVGKKKKKGGRKKARHNELRVFSQRGLVSIPSWV